MHLKIGGVFFCSFFVSNYSNSIIPHTVSSHLAHPPVVSVGHPHNGGHGVVGARDEILQVGAPKHVQDCEECTYMYI